MRRKTKLRLAAFGGAISVLGLTFGWAAANTALDSTDCATSYVAAAYGVCR